MNKKKNPCKDIKEKWMLCMGCITMYILHISWGKYITSWHQLYLFFPTKCTLLTRTYKVHSSYPSSLAKIAFYCLICRWNFKQEAHGPYRSPDKPLHMSSYDYIITLNRRGKSHDLLFQNWMVSICNTWIPFTQGCFVPSLVEISPVVQWFLTL